MAGTATKPTSIRYSTRLPPRVSPSGCRLPMPTLFDRKLEVTTTAAGAGSGPATVRGRGGPQLRVWRCPATRFAPPPPSTVIARITGVIRGIRPSSAAPARGQRAITASPRVRPSSCAWPPPPSPPSPRRCG
jgi:hypothetical protein